MWTLIASLHIGNAVLLFLNLPLIRIWINILAIPRAVLYTGIPVFGTLGVYSLANSVVDVLVMYVIAVMGFFMRRYGFPVGPMVLGVILMPLAEAQFRRVLAISQGDPTVFLTCPLSLGLLLVAGLAYVLSYLPALIARLRGQTRPNRAYGVWRRQGRLGKSGPCPYTLSRKLSAQSSEMRKDPCG